MATKQITEVQIRWMVRRDMPEVLAIENASFPIPWTEEEFIDCMKQRNCIGMVAEHDERIAGVMVYELLKSKLHVLNFAVHPEFRRQQVGSQMVDKLISKLSQQCGFWSTGVIRGHYDDTDEDAYQFVRGCDE